MNKKRVRLVALAAAVFVIFTSPLLSPLFAESLRQIFDSLPAERNQAASRVSLLDDNMRSWIARWKTVLNARSSVLVTNWVVSNDAFGKAFLGLLVEKARQGVKIELMVDGRGTAFFSLPLRGRDYLQELASCPNTSVVVYNPLLSALGKVVEQRDILALWASNHDKIVAVDGRSVIIGGRNIAKYYFYDPRDVFTAYRDNDILIEDPAVVKRMSEIFHSEFCSEQGKPVRPDTPFNIRKRDTELLFAARLMHFWLSSTPFDEDSIAALNNSEAERRSAASELLEAFYASQSLELAERRPRYVDEFALDLVTGPRLKGALNTRDIHARKFDNVEVRVLDRPSLVNSQVADDLNTNLLALIDAAREEIVIANAYFVLTKKALAAFERAAARGVRITLLTNSPKAGSSGFTQAHFVAHFAEILDRVPTLRIFVFDEEHVKMHGKVAVFDGRLTALGSYNIDLVSAKVNGELATINWSSEFAGQCKAWINDFIRNGIEHVVEYRISHDTKGRVKVEFGPRDHCSDDEMEMVHKYQKKLAVLKKLSPTLANELM